MADYSLRQLQRTIAQLEQAIYNHEQWHKVFLRTLIARLPSEASDLLPDAHLRCRFGQWYTSDETQWLRDNAAFIAIGSAHEQMHQSARHLLQRLTDDLPISAADVDQFNNLLDRMRLEIQSLRRELVEAMQNRAPLTGARNRVTMLTDLREQLALVRRGVQQCAIVLIDLDRFKDVNDRHGHLVGDAVLAAVSKVIQSQVRPYDSLYRYGGEEFLLCLPNSSLEIAVGLAERLRRALGASEIRTTAGGPVLQITASFGVATLEPSWSVEESIDRADKALYEAKSGGRNRVETLADSAVATGSA